MSGQGLRRRVLTGFVRTANFVIAGIGATMIGYGGYLATQFSGSLQMWASLIALGVLNFLFASILLCWSVDSARVLPVAACVRIAGCVWQQAKASSRSPNELCGLHYLPLSTSCSGYKSLFVLRLYGLVFGLLTIAEAAIALLFWVSF